MMDTKTTSGVKPAPLSIAVVGGGIAGLGAAWQLSKNHNVTLFEKQGRLGGHVNTVDLPLIGTDGSEGQMGIDTGFIVYNEKNYPELTALFDTLGVATQPSTMSFSVSMDDGRLEYAGSNLDTLYAQRGNFFRLSFQKFVLEILRFNRLASDLARSGGSEGLSLRELLDREKFGPALRQSYLLPMARAIWSCPNSTMLEMPALTLAKFFENHGLLRLRDRPQWRTVTGGSKRYLECLLKGMTTKVRPASPVLAVERSPQGPLILGADGRHRQFDHVVVATHADEALALVDAPGNLEKSVLGAFRYQANQAVLHQDTSLMPKRRKVWSAWNYLASASNDDGIAPSVTYWMNRLQRLTGEGQYFVSLNPKRPPQGIIAAFDYKHPVFDRGAIAAQRRLGRNQGHGGLWFCGSYCGYGFHEDALRSGLEVARNLCRERVQ